MEFNQTEISKLAGHKLLNDWEKGFIESVIGQLEKGYKISHNQERIIKRCFDKTSEDEMKKLEDWESKYDDNKRKIAKIIAEYYTEAGYFTNWAAKILANPDTYILPEKTWAKMCENKYAKKVLANMEAPKLFEIGGLATVRKAINHNHLVAAQATSRFHYSKMKNQTVMILDYEVKPAQHKVVKCALLMDPTIVFTCEERRLKKHRG